MNTAKIFINGRSQAVRLPKNFRFKSNEVYINKIDNVIMLISKNNPWANLINSLDKFSDDFMTKKSQPKNQKREIL